MFLTLTILVGGAAFGLTVLTGPAEADAAVFIADTDDSCTNLTGTVRARGQTWSYIDDIRRLRNMPLAWQRGDAIPGRLMVDESGQSGRFISDDGYKLELSRFYELHCFIN